MICEHKEEIKNPRQLKLREDNAIVKDGRIGKHNSLVVKHMHFTKNCYIHPAHPLPYALLVSRKWNVSSLFNALSTSDTHCLLSEN